MAERIIDRPITEIAEKAFAEYTMEVIAARALPDVCDGLKPVQRRILWSMYETGYLPETKYRKCARIVGDTMGKYHPHGDSSIYDALVKQAQPFVRRYPLVDGHGNFGSTDDNAAAMRYTEARLDKNSIYLLDSIKKDTVDFVSNFDESEKEPVKLPARFPNLLVNGTSGIAVGMASQIPTHNMSEVIGATIALIRKKDASLKDMMKYIKGPDFGTGGILDPEGLEEAYATGRGAVAIRGHVSIEAQPCGSSSVIIKSLPYGVKVEGLLGRISDLVAANNWDYVSAISNESSTEVGMRLRIDISSDGDAEKFINLLFKKTPLQSNFNFNMNALVNGRPKKLPLITSLHHFIDHRRTTFVREIQFDLKKAKKRAMILEGLMAAMDQLDAVIKLIRKSNSTADAKTALMKFLKINKEQAQAIVDVRLGTLTRMDIKKLKTELTDLKKQIAKWEDLLASETKIDKAIISDLKSIIDQEDQRLTEVKSFEELEYSIKVEKIIICGEGRKYSSRKRIGKFTGPFSRTTTDDMVISILSSGMCRNFHPDQHESFNEEADIVNLFSAKEIMKYKSIVFVTSNGMVKRTDPSEVVSDKDLQAIIKFKGDAKIVNTHLVKDDSDLILESKGMAIRFKVSDLPTTGRIGIGVLGMKLTNGESVTSSFTGDELLDTNRKDLMKLKVQKRAGKGSRLSK